MRMLHALKKIDEVEWELQFLVFKGIPPPHTHTFKSLIKCIDTKQDCKALLFNSNIITLWPGNIKHHPYNIQVHIFTGASNLMLISHSTSIYNVDIQLLVLQRIQGTLWLSHRNWSLSQMILNAKSKTIVENSTPGVLTRMGTEPFDIHEML